MTDFAQHAKANAAAADLLQARQEAQMTRDQVAGKRLADAAQPAAACGRAAMWRGWNMR